MRFKGITSAKRKFQTNGRRSRAIKQGKRHGGGPTPSSGFSLPVNQADNSFVSASIEGTKKYPAAVGMMKSLGSFSVLRTLPVG